MIKLLFIDLDGTLVHDTDDVSPRNVAALKAAQDLGVKIVICTGRSRFEVEPVARQWQGHGYAITNNGAMITDWETGEVLARSEIPSSVIKTAAKISHEMEVGLLGIGTDEDPSGQRIFGDAKFPIPSQFLDENSHRLHVVPDLREGAPAPVLTLLVFGTEPATKQVHEKWSAAIGDQVSVFHAPFSRHDTWCAYITPANANKGQAARKVAEILGVNREETMAIGDHLNDIELLEWAGIGVAMGNAHPTLKAMADSITESFTNDGVAAAIEHHILTAKPIQI